MKALTAGGPDRRKVVALILLVSGSIVLAWFLGILTPASAQEETKSTGRLVIVPTSPAVGDALEVLAVDVKPSDVELVFEFNDHFVPEAVSCDDAATQTTAPTLAPAWIPLAACTAGEGSVRLLEASTESVIAEATVTISETGGGARPRQQGCGLIYEQPCPPAPSISVGFSPNTPSDNYNISISWGGTGYNEYRVSGDFGSFTTESTSDSYRRPCERSYNIGVSGYGNSLHFAPLWSPSSSKTITTPDCPDPVITEPGAVTSFTLNAGDGKLTASWRTPTSNGGSAITLPAVSLIALAVTDSLTAAAQEGDPPGEPTDPTGAIAWNVPAWFSVTGYRILRGDTAIHEDGGFEPLLDDTDAVDGPLS